MSFLVVLLTLHRYQVIALVGYLRTRNVRGPFIIAAPLATLPNWINEFHKWLPEMPTLLYHGSKAERTQMRAELMPVGALGKDSNFPVIITSYEICIIDRKHLEKSDTLPPPCLIDCLTHAFAGIDGSTSLWMRGSVSRIATVDSFVS